MRHIEAKIGGITNTDGTERRGAIREAVRNRNYALMSELVDSPTQFVEPFVVTDAKMHEVLGANQKQAPEVSGGKEVSRLQRSASPEPEPHPAALSQPQEARASSLGKSVFVGEA